MNLTTHIKEVLQEFMKEFCKRHFSGGEIGTISHHGVFNDFNMKRIDHANNLKEISKVIRSTLMIDEKW